MSTKSQLLAINPLFGHRTETEEEVTRRVAASFHKSPQIVHYFADVSAVVRLFTSFFATHVWEGEFGKTHMHFSTGAMAWLTAWLQPGGDPGDRFTVWLEEAEITVPARVYDIPRACHLSVAADNVRAVAPDAVHIRVSEHEIETDVWSDVHVVVSVRSRPRLERELTPLDFGADQILDSGGVWLRSPAYVVADVLFDMILMLLPEVKDIPLPPLQRVEPDTRFGQRRRFYILLTDAEWKDESEEGREFEERALSNLTEAQRRYAIGTDALSPGARRIIAIGLTLLETFPKEQHAMLVHDRYVSSSMLQRPTILDLLPVLWIEHATRWTNTSPYLPVRLSSSRPLLPHGVSEWLPLGNDRSALETDLATIWQDDGLSETDRRRIRFHVDRLSQQVAALTASLLATQ